MTIMNESEWRDHERPCLMAVGMFVALVAVNILTTIGSYALLAALWQR